MGHLRKASGPKKYYLIFNSAPTSATSSPSLTPMRDCSISSDELKKALPVLKIVAKKNFLPITFKIKSF